MKFRIRNRRHVSHPVISSQGPFNLPGPSSSYIDETIGSVNGMNMQMSFGQNDEASGDLKGIRSHFSGVNGDNVINVDNRRIADGRNYTPIPCGWIIP
jgi:hypothetical protein